MRAARLRAVLTTLPLALALAACGSTVQATSSGTAGASTAGDELSGPGQVVADGLGGTGTAGSGGFGAGGGAGGAGDTGGTGGTGGSGAGTTSGVGGAGTGGTGTGGSGTGASGAGATGSSGGGGSTGVAGGGGAGTGGAAPVVSVAKTGRGWDEKNVYIGVTTQKDAEKAFGAVGLDDINPGDNEKQAQAVADAINAKGGLFGRQVKLVFRDHSTVEVATNPTAAGSATCAFFTQDRPVIAVVNIVTLMDGQNFRSCLARGRVTLLSSTVIAVDDAVSRALNPYYVQTLAVSWNALAPAMVSSLKAQGYFSGWDVRSGAPGKAPVRVGILASGDDVGTRVGAVVKRALAAGGIKDSLVFQYGEKTQGQQSSVLAFAGKGVTHVIVTDVELLSFMTSANGQGFRPRYGISSYNAPVTQLQSLAPAGQLNGALGVGWSPALDVDDAHSVPSAGGAACNALQARAGQTFAGKRLALAASQALCDAIQLTARSAVAGGGLTPEQRQQGLLRIGPSFVSAVGFSTALTQAKPFVPGSVRGTLWDAPCRCFRYSSGAVRL